MAVTQIELVSTGLFTLDAGNNGKAFKFASILAGVVQKSVLLFFLL